MDKLTSCRAAIVADNPEFARNPDRLLIWADKGTIATRRTAQLGYEWRYRANILCEALTGSPDTVMVPLLLWLRDAQPDLLLNFERGNEAVKFEAHILDETSWDVKIEFDLTEAIVLTPKAGGGWDITHLPEPSPVDQPLDGAGFAPLGEIWLGDQLLGQRP
jgi:P2 phage tail completion protein R (GpR)